MNFSHHIPVYGHYQVGQEIYSDEFQEKTRREQYEYSILHATTSAGTAMALDMMFFGGTAMHGFGYVRPVISVLGSGATPLIVIPGVLAAANSAVISKLPEEQQRGAWQMFASALTGTFGVGSAVQL